MRMMTEMSCQRRDLIWNNFTTEMKPAAFSASSSCRISSISLSTSSQPRSRCSAAGREQTGVRGWPQRPQSTGAAALSPLLLPQRSLTFPGRCRVFLLNQQVPGALGEEGQQQELRRGRDPSHAQENRPACRDASGSHEAWLRAASRRGPPQPRVPPRAPSGPRGAQPATLSHFPGWSSLELEHRLCGDRAFVLPCVLSA